MPEIIRKQDQKTSQWIGGTTTELFLYPPGGSYASRRFLFRVSSAYCEEGESVFTSLPGVRRILMVLDGHITLCHNGNRKVTLEKGDQDHFTGDEITKSNGSCVDFNLMMKDGAEGNLFFRKLHPEEKIALTDFCIKEKTDLTEGSYFGIYLARGKAALEKHPEEPGILLKNQDFCMFREGEHPGAWYVKAESDSEVVLAEIMCKTADRKASLMEPHIGGK